MKKFKTVNEYIKTFPSPMKERLEEIRTIIQKAIPDAEEIISYNMPAYKTTSVAVYFAGYKNHIGFYPTSSGIKNFSSEFKDYQWSKGAVQFPLDKKLPATLITKISKFRAKEINENRLQKTKVKK